MNRKTRSGALRTTTTPVWAVRRSLAPGPNSIRRSQEPPEAPRTTRVPSSRPSRSRSTDSTSTTRPEMSGTLEPISASTADAARSSSGTEADTISAGTPSDRPRRAATAAASSEWGPPPTAATTLVTFSGWKSIGTATLARSNEPGGSLRATRRSARWSMHSAVRSPHRSAGVPHPRARRALHTPSPRSTPPRDDRIRGAAPFLLDSLSSIPHRIHHRHQRSEASALPRIAMDDHVGPGRLAVESPGPSIGRRVAGGDHPDGLLVLRETEECGKVGHGMYAEEPRTQTPVHRGQQHGHHRRPGVDPPVGDGPGDLTVLTELVRLLIATVIHLLAHRDHDVRRRLRDPRVESRSEEHTSELQSVRISYAVFCLKKKKTHRPSRLRAQISVHSSQPATPNTPYPHHRSATTPFPCITRSTPPHCS